MFKVPSNTSSNPKEYKPDQNSIGFAPELIKFIQDNKKLTTYRFGKKYDHFKAGDVINYDDSSLGKHIGRIKVIAKREVTFADLPLESPTHETYRDKEHQRKVLSGYYAYLGRKIKDDDPFLVFDFELVERT